MSSVATIVFPHQLFEKNPALQKGNRVLLVEEPLYFTQFPFHQKKLMLHRASMKFYHDFLVKKGYQCEYIEAREKDADLENLFKRFRKEKIGVVTHCDTADYLLDRRLKHYASRHNIELKSFDSPQFINSQNDLKGYFEKTNDYFLHQFYMKERKRLKILVEDNKAVGGRWSFDADNRKKIPKGLAMPSYFTPSENKYVTEAREYVQKHFSHHLGTTDNFVYAVNYADARKWLEDFLSNRFQLFGPFEDAMLADGVFLFHSVLTPYLNTGLLTPAEVVQKIIEAGTEYNIPLASLEGYIRQIIGWREFMRGVYQYKGVFQRKRNFWNHSRAIPKSFYDGTTGIAPVDHVISRLQRHAYTHHIERLMVMGNFMMLCEFDPDLVYQWFMEFYIDAYDWVMVPNVYGMSQFADGGIMSTKPYMSGSNYVLKMSNYKKDDWSKIWDGLYWRFIYKHNTFFAGNQRTMMITRTLSKMDKDTLKKHVKTAEQYLQSLS